MNTKNNQRYQETEKLIQNTLLSLAQDKDIHDLIYKMGLEMMNDVGAMMRRSGGGGRKLLSIMGKRRQTLYAEALRLHQRRRDVVPFFLFQSRVHLRPQ